MSIDRSKGVQWMMEITEEFPQIPVTILESDEDLSTMPKVLYNGPYNEDIVTALAEHGYVYNYTNEPPTINTMDNPYLLYSTNATNAKLLIIAGDASISEETGLTFASDEYQYKLQFNSDVANSVTGAFTLMSDDVKLVMEPIELPYAGVCTVLECLMVQADTQPIPAGPDIILISNPTEADFGANIGVPEGVTTTLNGPTGGATEIEGGIGICLSPIQPVTAAIQETTTQCVKMEGLFAIEINGEMVPYHFGEKDLTKFFNSTNPYGIQFLDCNAPIECVPTSLDFDYYNAEYLDGGWALQFSFNDGPIMRWEEVDMGRTHPSDLFDYAMSGVWNSEAAVGTMVSGGGGWANFQCYYGTVAGGAGGPQDTPVKVTFHRIDYEFGGHDLFDYFFDLNGSLASIDVMSCGEQDWPGY